MIQGLGFRAVEGFQFQVSWNLGFTIEGYQFRVIRGELVQGQQISISQIISNQPELAPGVSLVTRSRGFKARVNPVESRYPGAQVSRSE